MYVPERQFHMVPSQKSKGRTMFMYGGFNEEDGLIINGKQVMGLGDQ
jgi:hypothetical protein